MVIKFNNLELLHEDFRAEIEQSVSRVLRSGYYILGPEVESLEKEFAEYVGVKHALAVANGTDALELSLRVAGVGKGDEVITVSHTAVATVNAIERCGASPVLVDIDPDTFCMDPKLIEQVINTKTKAIIPVHIYGQPADMNSISKIADKYNLLVVEDCAQAHGAKIGNQKVGTFGHLAAFSFYPTKNLGAYGDAGMIVTNNSEIAKRVKRIRNYGQINRYEFVEWGVNSRMDEIQAAVLRIKLKSLDKLNKKRQKIARLYLKNILNKKINLPNTQKKIEHVFHLFVINTKNRDELSRILKDKGIDTLIHYPQPVHLQPAYRHLNYHFGSLPVTEKLTQEILSLPLYIGLRDNEIKYICQQINNAKI